MKKSLWTMFQEDDGAWSMSRVFLGMSIFYANNWITYLVIRNGTLPDLGGLSLFVAGIGTVTYGYNQIKQVVKAVKAEEPKPTT